MAHANFTSWPAPQASPAWLRRFFLDLAQDDHNHDLHIVLPVSSDGIRVPCGNGRGLAATHAGHAMAVSSLRGRRA